MSYSEWHSVVDGLNSAYAELLDCLKPGNSGAHGQAPHVMEEVEELLNLIVEDDLYLAPKTVAALTAYVAEIAIRCYHCDITTLNRIQRWRGINPVQIPLDRKAVHKGADVDRDGAGLFLDMRLWDR